jgi:hypothetical protein
VAAVNSNPRVRVAAAALVLACAGSIACSARANPHAAKIKNPVIPTPESLTAGTGVHLTREI